MTGIQRFDTTHLVVRGRDLLQGGVGLLGCELGALGLRAVVVHALLRLLQRVLGLKGRQRKHNTQTHTHKYINKYMHI